MSGNIKNSSADFKFNLKSLSTLVEKRLSANISEVHAPQKLVDAMEYSLLAGGKRVRPVLCLSWAGMLGASVDHVLDFACAIEFIHTYSLMHDDLPAMDDDDLRRGKPTCHKVFGEALAILAGDALLTHAFHLMSSTALSPEYVLSATRLMSEAAGPAGMVGGQVIDILATGTDHADLESLKKMHVLKTGALIRASCMCGAILAGANAGKSNDLENASTYGQAIGLAFQIVDDILDITGDEALLGKPVGSDEGSLKATYPRFLGLDKSMSLARESVGTARAALEGYSGSEKDFLWDLAGYIVDRVS